MTTPSRSQAAYQWIKSRIVQGQFTPGYRLVLAAVAAELDMSVVPVREALRLLEAEGLITFERNIGARVAMTDDWQYQYSMRLLALLEGAATAEAAPFVTDEDLATARQLNVEMTNSLGQFDPHAFTELNHQFHEVLFARCPNPRLVDLVRAEWTRLAHLRDSTFSFVPGRAIQSTREHDHILDLIVDGGSAFDIEQATRSHLNSTLQAYLAAQHPVIRGTSRARDRHPFPTDVSEPTKESERTKEGV